MIAMTQLTDLSSAKQQLLKKYLFGKSCGTATAIAKRSPIASSPAAPAQWRMLQHMKSCPSVTCYNEPITIHRNGSLDISLLERSFTELIRRHECWRTTFNSYSDPPRQVVRDPFEVQIPLTDLRNVSESDREGIARHIASEDARKSFDLEHGPLFRVRVIQVADQQFKICVTAHHLILDGVTVFEILLSEISAIYDALESANQPSLPDLTIQYSDFAEWQREQLCQSAAVNTAADYWRSRLSSFDSLDWRTGRTRPGKKNYKGAVRPFVISNELSAGLRTISQEQGSTLFVTLMTGFTALLYRLTQSSKLVIGTVTPGERKRTETQKLMGLFQNRVPLHIDATGNPTLGELQTRIRAEFMEVMTHDDVPFDLVEAQLLPDQVDQPNTFLPAMFSLEPPLPSVSPSWDFSTMDFDPNGSRHDLYIEMDARSSGIMGRAQYDTDIFTTGNISDLLHGFEDSLKTLAANPDIRIADLSSINLSEHASVEVCPVANEQLLAPRTSCPIHHDNADPTGTPENATHAKNSATPAKNGRVPPLSLYHLLDPDVLANPYPLYRRLQEEDQVHWDPYLHAWIVTRYADVVTVLLRFSADRTPTPERLAEMGLSKIGPIAQVMVKQMLFLDPPAHTRLRSLASQAFTPARVAVLRKHIQEICNSLIDRVVSKGKMDVIRDLAAPLPAIVTAEMLGVPMEDHEQLKDWSADFAEMLGNFQHNPDHVPKVLRTVDDMTAYFRSAIRQQHIKPREGLVRSLMTAEVAGDHLTEEEVVANSIVTMVGGQETTTNLIGNGILSLLRNPGEMERLRSDYSIIPSAVEELLRYESPSQHTGRLAPEDVELGGKLIRKKQAVIAVMAAGNRDPARFPDPDRLDLTRQDNRHLAFGWAAHFCFGAALARIEGQVAFESMLRRLPGLTLEPGPLKWRTNLGLRGLLALPVTFEASTEKH